jgi:hypothetical protein
MAVSVAAQVVQLAAAALQARRRVARSKCLREEAREKRVPVCQVADTNAATERVRAGEDLA